MPSGYYKQFTLVVLTGTRQDFDKHFYFDNHSLKDKYTWVLNVFSCCPQLDHYGRSEGKNQTQVASLAFNLMTCTFGTMYIRTRQMAWYVEITSCYRTQKKTDGRMHMKVARNETSTCARVLLTSIRPPWCQSRTPKRKLNCPLVQIDHHHAKIEHHADKVDHHLSDMTNRFVSPRGTFFFLLSYSFFFFFSAWHFHAFDVISSALSLRGSWQV